MRLSPVLLSAALMPATLAGCANAQPLAPWEPSGRDGGYDGALSEGPGPLDDGSTPLADQGDGGGSIINVCDVRKLKINELANGGANGATDEFIELYNPCSGSVALVGSTLVYRAATSGGDNFTFATFGSVMVASHGYFVVANGQFAGTANIKPFQGGGGMAAAGGGIALRDPQDMVVDSVAWGTAVNAYVEGTVATAPSTTQSLARTPNGTDTNDNNADFQLVTPTPGVSN